MTFLTMTTSLMQLSFNVVPASVQNLDLSDLERYFALGRGYQGRKRGRSCPSDEEMVQHQLPLHRS